MYAPFADFCCIFRSAAAPGTGGDDVWFCQAAGSASSSGVTILYCVILCEMDVHSLGEQNG